MDTTYYDHGSAAERWERARMFFDAKDYAAAARVLGPLVEEVPEQTGHGCCWPAPTTTRPNCAAPRPSCGFSSSGTRWSTTPG